MCDFSKREAAMVTVRPGVHCDPCLVPLVRALYENGFPTVASCCGHGKQPASIALADGRWVFVADAEQAEAIWGIAAAEASNYRRELAVANGVIEEQKQRISELEGRGRG